MGRLTSTETDLDASKVTVGRRRTWALVQRSEEMMSMTVLFDSILHIKQTVAFKLIFY